MPEFQVAFGDTAVTFANPTYKKSKKSNSSSGGRKVAKKTKKRVAKKKTAKKVTRKKVARKKTAKKKVSRRKTAKKVVRKKTAKKKVSRRKTSRKVGKKTTKKTAGVKRKTRRSKKRRNPSRVTVTRGKKVVRQGIVPNSRDVAQMVSLLNGLKRSEAAIRTAIGDANLNPKLQKKYMKDLALLRAELKKVQAEKSRFAKVAKGVKGAAKKGEVLKITKLADDVAFSIDEAEKLVKAGKTTRRKTTRKKTSKRKTDRKTTKKTSKVSTRSGGKKVARKKTRRKTSKKSKGALSVIVHKLKKAPKRAVSKRVGKKRVNRKMTKGTKGRVVMKNPIFSASLERSQIGRQFSMYLGHSLSEAGGLAIGGIGLVTAPRIVEKALGYVSPALYSKIEGRLGVFTGSLMTLAFGVAVGMANDKFLKNGQLESAVKGVIGASFVGMGATAGEMLAERGMIPASIAPTPAPALAGPYVRKQFEGFVDKGFEGFVDKGFEGFVDEGFEGGEEEEDFAL